MLHFTSPFFLCGIPFFQLSLQNRQQPLTPLVHHGSSLYLFQWTVWVCLKIHLPNPLLHHHVLKSPPCPLWGMHHFSHFFPSPAPARSHPRNPGGFRWRSGAPHAFQRGLQAPHLAHGEGGPPWLPPPGLGGAGGRLPWAKPWSHGHGVPGRC